MSRFEKNIKITNDLLLIQHERATAYERIVKYADQEELICKFLKKIAVQSRNYMLELRSHIDLASGDPADRLVIKGEVYRKWPGIKHFMPGSSTNEIILTCEYNEMATAMAYQRALTSGKMLRHELRRLFDRQLKTIEESCLFIHECKKKPAAPVTTQEIIRPVAFIRADLYAEAWVN